MQHQRKEMYPLIQTYIAEYREKYGLAPSLSLSKEKTINK